MKHHVMKVLGGSGGGASPFLTSKLEESEWSASYNCHFASGETAHSNHWIRGCLGPRAGLLFCFYIYFVELTETVMYKGN